MKRLVVVGNGPLSRDLGEVVDTADFVVRFNEPKQGIGMSGTRTDRLIMANSGKPMERRLRDPKLIPSAIFQNAGEIMLAYHPAIIRRYFRAPHLLSRLKGRRTDWTLPTIEKFGAAGKEIRIMPVQFYLDGCRELGVPEEKMHEIFPSTGYFGIRHALNTFPMDRWRLELCGFSWSGWRRHAWGDERRWVEARVEKELIRIIDAAEK